MYHACFIRLVARLNGAVHMEFATPTEFDGTRDAALLAPLRIAYESAGDAAHLIAQPDVLAVIGFGNRPAPASTAGFVQVDLQPLDPAAPFEVWRGLAPVRRGRSGAIAWSSNGDYTFASLELDESANGGIAATAHTAYAMLRNWCLDQPERHLLRIWNYLDAINDGSGDDERYRQFCAGRASGLEGMFATGFPAATAIGRRDGRRVLQLYWLAARMPGAPLENPRQLSAWRYPRRYGPSAPSFARAMRAPVHDAQIYISGTAAIVGHSSHHAEDCLAQLDETLANLDSLIGSTRSGGVRHFGPACALKVYVRHAQDAAEICARLHERIGTRTPVLLLLGDICRAELLIEIDGVYAT